VRAGFFSEGVFRKYYFGDVELKSSAAFFGGIARTHVPRKNRRVQASQT